MPKPKTEKIMVAEHVLYCIDNFINIHRKGPRLSAWVCGYPKNS